MSFKRIKAAVDRDYITKYSTLPLFKLGQLKLEHAILRERVAGQQYRIGKLKNRCHRLAKAQIKQGKYIEELKREVRLLNLLRYDADFDDDEFASLLTKLLDELGLSDKEAADRLHVSIPTIKRWKAGRNTPYYTLGRLVISWLMDRVKERKDNA